MNAKELAQQFFKNLDERVKGGEFIVKADVSYFSHMHAGGMEEGLIALICGCTDCALELFRKAIRYLQEGSSKKAFTCSIIESEESIKGRIKEGKWLVDLAKKEPTWTPFESSLFECLAKDERYGLKKIFQNYINSLYFYEALRDDREEVDRNYHHYLGWEMYWINAFQEQPEIVKGWQASLPKGFRTPEPLRSRARAFSLMLTSSGLKKFHQNLDLEEQLMAEKVAIELEAYEAIRVYFMSTAVALRVKR